MNINRSRLGELLVQRQFISLAQLRTAMTEQRTSGGRLGDILVRQKAVTRRQITAVLRWQLILRKLCVVLACLMSPWQVAMADDHKKPSMLAKSLCYLSRCHKSYADQLPSFGDGINSFTGNSSDIKVAENLAHAQREDNQLTASLKGKLGIPLWTVISREYEIGVDQYHSGMNYKAKWSEDSIKLEVKYQF